MTPRHFHSKYRQPRLLPRPQDILLPHELDSLLKATHRPNYVLQVRHSDTNAWGPAT
jgi:hypothetical protein